MLCCIIASKRFLELKFIVLAVRTRQHPILSPSFRSRQSQYMALGLGTMKKFRKPLIMLIMQANLSDVSMRTRLCCVNAESAVVKKLFCS